MIVTVTERGVYKRCRRQWDYSSFNRQSIAKIVQRKTFALGSMMHQSLAEWCMEPDSTLKDIFLKVAVLELERTKEAYKKQVGAPISEIELDVFYESVDLGANMADNYQKRWKTPLPTNFEIVAPEQQILVAIPGTEHQLEGKLDAIIRDKKERVFVLERKTYDRRPTEPTLQSNDQFLAYLWVLKQLNLGPVGGVAYDGMWKRPAPPRGKVFEDLHFRTMLYRPSYELEEFEQHLAWEANEMASNPPIYINRRWEGCYDCDFEALCTATSRGEDVDFLLHTQYTKRERQSDDFLEEFTP